MFKVAMLSLAEDPLIIKRNNSFTFKHKLLRNNNNCYNYDYYGGRNRILHKTKFLIILNKSKVPLYTIYETFLKVAFAV